MAERYYQHKVPFTLGRTVSVWPWDGEHLAFKPVQLTPAQAEEYFGLRYVREAIELDPKYQQAQVVLLSLLLDRTLAPDLDQLLLKPLPAKIQQLLATLDTDVVDLVLERAAHGRQCARHYRHGACPWRTGRGSRR